MIEKKIEIWGNANNAKDMPYIKDFSVLIGKAISHNSAQGIYNAGTGNPVTLNQFVDSIIEVFSDGMPIEKIYLPDCPSQPNFTFDMTRTCEEFDFNVHYNIKDMLNDIKIVTKPALWIQPEAEK